MQLIKEGKCSAWIYPAKIISRELPVFYNPVMKINRDISVLLLRAIGRKSMKIADILAGSGIRSIRFLKELPKSTVNSIAINDANPNAVKLIKKNLRKNKISANKKISVSCSDASSKLLSSSGFDYIDIDPFGSPNPFLDAACKQLAREGILAITATDTAALAGASPNACMRKYWAQPLRNYFMHETALRILIRKCQLVAAQYEKALTPIFCHSTEHYLRVYLKCEKSRIGIKSMFANHNYILFCQHCLETRISRINSGACCKKQMQYAGPLWTGNLWYPQLTQKMLASADSSSTALYNMLKAIADEARVPTIGFYDLPALASNLKIGNLPKKQLIMNALAKHSPTSITHITPEAIRSFANIKEVRKIIQSLSLHQ